MSIDPTAPDRRIAGMLLIAGSTAFFALAGIFTKTATTDAWTIACWRGFTGGLIITAYVFFTGSTPLSQRFALGWRGWALAVNGAVSSIAFIGSFKHTFVANVAIIYATAPFMAAIVDWLFRGERARTRTLIAAAVSLGGVAVMMGGGFAGGNLFGDGLALFMTALCAVYLVMVRAWRDTPVVWAGAVAAFILATACLFIIDPLAVSRHDAIVMCMFGVSYACAVILWTEGARLLPAAEAGLLGSTEVPIAVLFSWLILAELPPLASFIGGGIVLAAVLAYATADMIAESRRRAAVRVTA